jgi:uncharacterized protein
MSRPIIWSVHDVTPSSLERAAHIVDLVIAAGVTGLSILIVPSGTWAESQLMTLRAWEHDGHLLAAHGWTHRSVAPRGAYHRLHSLLFSRDVAEHLGRPAPELIQIVRKAEHWFSDAGLAPPTLYVPPAWALGEMALGDFRGTSFRWVETLSGIHDTATMRSHRLPIVGFEADTWLRARALRLSNRANVGLAHVLRRPIRVAIHPNDFSLALSSQLLELLNSGRPTLSPADLA